MKKNISKKNAVFILFICIFIILIITSLIVFLYSNTSIFKSKEEVKDDLLDFQNKIKNEESSNVISSQYSKDVGVSQNTLYVKENASDKLKDAIKGTEIGLESSTKTEKGFVILEPYAYTSATECKIINPTKDVVTINAYNYNSLYDIGFEVGSISKEEIKNGANDFEVVLIAPNTTYSIESSIQEGVNTAIFFDKDMKYISDTTEKTFTTPSNAKYIKIITENTSLQPGDGVQYAMNMGEECLHIFDASRAEVRVNIKDQDSIYLPLNNEKTVIYVDGGELELKYVTK